MLIYFAAFAKIRTEMIFVRIAKLIITVEDLNNVTKIRKLSN